MNKIEFGDCREIMKRWKEEGVKVQTVVTSPPYFGLRDYGHDGQIGLEETVGEYVANIVDVFADVWNILEDDGTVWLNLGDSYYNYRPGKGQALNKQTVSNTNQDLPTTCARRGNKQEGLKEKDLIGIPWRVAFALQDFGWYLRQDIIWHKPNPMPESVRDRCTKAHEYIFLFTKNPQYYFDNEAIKEPSVNKESYKGRRKRSAMTEKSEIIMDKFGATRNGFKNIEEGKTYPIRNKRSVWTVTTKPYKGAHFATFPKELIEPCIKAGCPKKICVSCGASYQRQKKVEKNLTLEEVELIRNNIIETNKERKPYAILDAEFRNQVVEYRNLPDHNELKEYLQFNKNLVKLTIDQIESAFGTQAPHHWFEKNGSYPSKEDWLKLKQMLLLDDKYDIAMTEIFYKSGLKGVNSYIDEGLIKQCKCETNETKAGIVFDPFMGSGTTAQVAKELGRQYLGCELNPEYKKLQDERLNKII